MGSLLVVGRVVNGKTGQVVRDGSVEFWLKRRRAPIASTAVDDRGMFRLEIPYELGKNARGELEVRVSRNGDALKTTQDPLHLERLAGRAFLRVAVDVPAEVVSKRRIVVRSYDDLIGHEEEIRRRINSAQMGPHRFLLEPFQLLADVGVRVTPIARDEILKRLPGLRSVSATPYEALKRSTRRQSTRFQIRSLTHRHGERSAR